MSRKPSSAEPKESCLFVINSLEIGGAERILFETVKALAPAFDITVLVFDAYPHAKNFTEEMSHYAKIRTRLVYNAHAPFLVRKAQEFWLRLNHYVWDEVSPRWFYRLAIGGRRRYDREIAFLEGRPTRAVSGSTNATNRRYAWVHTDMTSEHCAHDFRSFEEEQSAYAGFDRVFAVSSDVARSVKTQFEVDATFVQNIIDDVAVKQRAQSACDMEWQHRPALVSVGRLAPVKGFERLIEAAGVLRDRGREFELHIVGEGSELDRLQALIIQFDLSECVYLDGFRDNPYPSMARADLFVCSSYSEGFSGTVTESLVLGTAVLATDCAGMHDLLGENEHGLIVQNSVEGLAEGLERLLVDQALLAHYTRRAAARGADFSTERLSAAVIALLRDDLPGKLTT